MNLPPSRELTTEKFDRLPPKLKVQSPKFKRNSRLQAPKSAGAFSLGKTGGHPTTTTEKREETDRGCARSASRSSSAGRACWDHFTAFGHSSVLRLVLRTQWRSGSGGGVKQLNHLVRRKKKVTLRVTWKMRPNRGGGQKLGCLSAGLWYGEPMLTKKGRLITLILLLCFKLAVAFAAESPARTAQSPAAESADRKQPIPIAAPGVSSANASAAVDDLILLERKSRSAPPIEAVPDEGAIARLTASVLARVHYLQKPLNDEVSSKFLDRYLETLDGLHMHFLKSDLEEFEQYRTVLDDLTMTGKTEPAREIFKRF